MRILIKGSGVAGLCLAHEGLGKGWEIVVAEPYPAFSKSASWLAGGMLAPWCERENAEEDVLTFGKRSIDWWQAALPGEVSCNGTLVVAPPRDLSELARFASRTSGFDWLEAPEIGALEPDLEGRFSRGLYFSGEAHLDPRRALLSLRDDLKSRGVAFVADDLEAGADFDLTADCTGKAARDTELRGVRGEMLILHAPEVTLSRPVRLLHPRIPVYIVPRDDHHFMVGATMIESDDEGPVSVRSTMELLNAAYSLHPAFAEAKIVETGAGVRPAYHDNLPRVHMSGDQLSLNGFYRHGFLLAPHYAAEAAQLISNAKRETSLEPHH